MAKPKKTKPKKTLWAVVLDNEHKFVTSLDGSGRVATSSDRKEADRTAKLMNGRVVDAAEWARNPKFLPQATTFQLFGPHGIELGISSTGKKHTAVRITKAAFKNPKRGPKTIVITAVYEDEP